LVTIKPDADALGAMAAWAMRRAKGTDGTSPEIAGDIPMPIMEIAAHDKDPRAEDRRGGLPA
jgi:hypothetical protein